MSASLVGSEMCIRDRRLSASQGYAGPAATTTAPVSLPESRAGKLAVGAVSYTHLTLPTICSV
eukprot:7497730-Alexandrium_andersonii.AAC.1